MKIDAEEMREVGLKSRKQGFQRERAQFRVMRQRGGVVIKLTSRNNARRFIMGVH